MTLIAGPWIKHQPAEKAPLPPSGLVDRVSLTKLKKELRRLAKLETTPPYRQDDILYAIEKATKIRYCYVVEGSEWIVWAMERAARLNLDNFARVRGKWMGIRGKDMGQVMGEVDLQLSHVPHMVPAKEVREEYAQYFGV